MRLGTTIMDNKSRMIMHCFCVAWHSKELGWWIWCFGSPNWNVWILLVVACHDQQSLVVATFIILPYFVPLWFFCFNKAHADSTITVVRVPFKPPVFPRRCIAGWNSQIFMVFPLVMFGASQMRCIPLSIRGSGWWSRVSFACWRWVGTVYIWWDFVICIQDAVSKNVNNFSVAGCSDVFRSRDCATRVALEVDRNEGRCNIREAEQLRDGYQGGVGSSWNSQAENCRMFQDVSRVFQACLLGTHFVHKQACE